jgi:hypothetical protein
VQKATHSKKATATWLTALIVGGLILVQAPMAQGSPPPDRPAGPPQGIPGPCALARTSDETIQDFSARLITCAAEVWTVPGGADRAVCIATRESGLTPTASSPKGRYRGLFQHSAKYWPGRYEEWTKAGWDLRRSAFNARTNAIVTIRMVHGIGRWVTAGWPTRGC